MRSIPIAAALVGCLAACAAGRPPVPLPPQAKELTAVPLAASLPPQAEGLTAVLLASPLPPKAQDLKAALLAAPLPPGAADLKAPPATIPPVPPTPAPKPSALTVEAPEAAAVTIPKAFLVRPTTKPAAYRGAVAAAPVAALGGLLLLEAHRAGDADAVAAVLQAEGISPATGKVRPLPRFMTGLHHLPPMSYTYKHEDVDLGTAPVRVMRLVDGSAEFIRRRMETGADERFVLLLPDGEGGLADGGAFRALADRRVVAIVLGQGIASDADPAEFPTKAREVLSLLALVRKVSDAPVLLAVSWTNHHAGRRDVAAGWCRAFGPDLGRFDGFAVHNAGTFPAWETLSLEKMAAALGLPRSGAMVLLEFEGTRAADDPGRRAEVWRMRGRRFIEERRREGWRGVFLVATGNSGGAAADCRAKAAFLRTLPPELQFQAQP